jgi:predicted O-methyltransferase YrrM
VTEIAARRRPAFGIALAQRLRDLRERVSQKVTGRIQLPWMKVKELDVITEVLTRLAPRECLEWGAGYSTLWFPRLLPSLERWTTVEHNREWFGQIADRNTDERVTLVHIAPDHGVYDTVKHEGTAEDFRTYIAYPRTLGRQFDFIFIDGRARKECLREAYDLVADRGVVVVHDANRDSYVADLPPFAHRLRLTDTRRGRGGVLIASRGRPIAEVCDAARQEQIWRAHDVIERVLLRRRRQ